MVGYNVNYTIEFSIKEQLAGQSEASGFVVLGSVLTFCGWAANPRRYTARGLSRLSSRAERNRRIVPESPHLFKQVKNGLEGKCSNARGSNEVSLSFLFA